MKKTTQWVSASLLAVLSLYSLAARAQTGCTVHEWGTFTSVQGGNGQSLSWRPLQTPELPNFVYDWFKPGLERKLAGFFVGNEPYKGKGLMVTLQRMETPVIYFYSGTEMNVDVSVSFPEGLITEWYPQAGQIGPSLPARTNESPDSATAESRASWNHLRILPSSQTLMDRLPVASGTNGVHYYAARETDSDLVQTSLSGHTGESETEKFLFYRGVGNFATPLRLGMNSDDFVTVENTGTEKLEHIFLLSVHDGYGVIASLQSLAANGPAQRLALAADPAGGHAVKRLPLKAFQDEIGAQMETALVEAGLFPREARAMINTWKDSWFTEEGERVLYLLPRAWTDETLPLNIKPQPAALVRVMVGRTEIISPKSRQQLAEVLARAATGDVAARNQAVGQLEKFGRFAEPALQLANVHTKTNNLEVFGYELLPQVASAQR